MYRGYSLIGLVILVCCLVGPLPGTAAAQTNYFNVGQDTDQAKPQAQPKTPVSQPAASKQATSVKAAAYKGNPFEDAEISPVVESDGVKARQKNFDSWKHCVVFLYNKQSSGSGFFINKKGYIITNHHVVAIYDKDGKKTRQYYQTINVMTKNGQTYTGEIMASNYDLDLALIRSPQATSYWLTLSEISEDMVGNDVLAIGAPSHLKWSLSKGIISAVRLYQNRQLVQTDTAINSGNSGGPLLLISSGKVVGVNTQGYVNAKGEPFEGLNMAVSTNEVRTFLEKVQP